MRDFNEIYKENFQIVYKYLISLTHDIDVAEELTQETFYRAVKNINSFKGKSKLSTWLCKIAKNLWINEIKRHNKMQEIKENDAIITDEDAILIKDEKLRLFKNIQELNVDMREVVYLRLSGDLSFKEIGQVMNKTENWARVTYYRAKEKLKEVDENEK